MSKDPLRAPELYINRELSWLEFNDRVLREGLSAELPLLERLKFLGIVSSNLDEFFLVRVAGLRQQAAADVRRRDPAGMTPRNQLKAIGERAHRMVAEQNDGIRDVFRALGGEGLHLVLPQDWTDSQRRYLHAHFSRDVAPVLTPLAIEELDPKPLLPNLQLHIAAVLVAHTEEGAREKIVIVPVPGNLPRAVHVPSEEGTYLARLEDVIATNLESVFPGCEVLASAAFRITRDADVLVHDDEAGDLLRHVENAVLARRRRDAVRLTISVNPDPRILGWLTTWLKLEPVDVYEVEMPAESAVLMEIVGRPGFDHLKLDDWPPQTPRDLIGAEDLWEAVKDRDILLFHPYEKFNPVVQLVEEAAADPQVLAIKQTLYRTSGDSPIVRALTRAAENGKEVTVLVELRARFDEARNVQWARRLEDAGAHVIYGVAGFKTHAKALLIVRRESQRIQRYVHLATGNYNDRTARLYSDLGLFTCDRDVTADVAAFFNLLTGYSEAVGWSKLSIAPTGLKQRFLDLIDREIQVSTPDRPGLIMVKVNSLQDADMCRALYRASQAGVEVKLNVRGICCLRPGVKGVSESIEVRSIVDRYLEHARIFYFRNGGVEEVYLSSADWMRRNLIRRLEILFPVVDPSLRRRLFAILETFFADNVKARVLKSDGVYDPVSRKGPRVRAQEKFYKDALAETRAAAKVAPQFQPLERPKE
ncbi:MAG: polyphosphate kinase 1 [Planctomycetota bacterium]